MSEIADKLAEVKGRGNEAEDSPEPGDVLTDSPGRGPSGKKRNFGAMGREKLERTIADLEEYGKDPEALAAARAELP